MTILNRKHIAIMKTPVRETDFFNANGVKIARYTLPDGLTKLSATIVFNTHRGYVKPLVATLMAHVCVKAGIEFAMSNTDVVLKSNDFEKLQPQLAQATQRISEKMSDFVSKYQTAKNHSDEEVMSTCTDPSLVPYQSIHTPFHSVFSQAAKLFFGDEETEGDNSKTVTVSSESYPILPKLSHTKNDSPAPPPVPLALARHKPIDGVSLQGNSDQDLNSSTY